MAWTKERVELLKKLWADGLPASTIAARLGGITRSAVCGKVWRIGLPRRPGAQHYTTANAHRRARAQARKLKPPPRKYQRRTWRYGAPLTPIFAILTDGLPLPPPHEIDIARVSFDDAEKHHCRWIPADIDPRGRPQDQPLYCGDETVAGTAYCRAHLKRLHGVPEIKPPPKAAWVPTDCRAGQRPARRLVREDVA